MTLSPDLERRVRDFVDGDPDPTTRAELLALLEGGNERELSDRMAGPLAFGTAGLRGVLGAGESRMNRAVILRTTFGLATYLRATLSDAASRGVVVGYDGRRMSREFAEDTARVLAAAGVRAFLFPALGPTPLTAFAAGRLRAACAVMVTASHNPPEYNGYKVYWENGAQIIPPHDAGIAADIARAPRAKDVPVLELPVAHRRGLLEEVGDDVVDAYVDEVARLSHDARGRELVRVVYTPLHGTGGELTPRVLRRFGFDAVHVVEEQRAPDGEFPTVRFPNPEEKGAMDLAFRDARAHQATLVLANDPDADRLAVAVPDGRGGYRQLTGNEVGVLLGEYLLRRSTAARRLAIASIVSSPMLGVICEKLGVAYEETLTGFKWIANRAIARAKEDTFVFGYEEALGYTVGELVRDKDGVSAAALFAELSAVAAAEGRSVLDELERLFRTYGLFVSAQHNVTRTGAEGAAEIRATMSRLRASLPSSLAGMPIVATRDLQTGLRTAGSTTFPIDLPRSDVLVLDLPRGTRVIARPSGTEPKIKYYFDLSVDIAEGEELASARIRAEAELAALSRDFLAVVGGA